MTVYFVNRFFHPHPAATSQLLSDLAFHLARQGRSVCVITSRAGGSGATGALPRFEVVRGVAVRRVAMTRFGLPSLLLRALDCLPFYLLAALETLRLAGRDDVIVAKTDPPMIGVLLMVVARIRGARFVNWLQDIFPEVAAVLGIGLAGGPAGKLLAVLRDCTLRQADCNVVLGDRMAAFVASRGVAPNRVSIIHNWTDDAAIVPLPTDPNPFAVEHGLADRFVVGYSGNLGRAHHFDTVLGAAELLGPDAGVTFLVIGYGVRLATVEAEVVRRGLRCFVFAPQQPRERLPISLGAAQLHLVTLLPRLEGLIVPSKFYGAAAAGRPVAFIGDVDGEIARIVKRHDCGRVFDLGDSAALAAYIVMLKDHPAVAARQGANARHALVRHYSRAHAFRMWEHALLETSVKPALAGGRYARRRG